MFELLSFELMLKSHLLHLELEPLRLRFGAFAIALCGGAGRRGSVRSGARFHLHLHRDLRRVAVRR